jgi:hypothetical protein
MVGEPQGAMRVALQIWQVVFASQTLLVFCLAFHKKAQYVVVCNPLFYMALFLRPSLIFEMLLVHIVLAFILYVTFEGMSRVFTFMPNLFPRLADALPSP